MKETNKISAKEQETNKISAKEQEETLPTFLGLICETVNKKQHNVFATWYNEKGKATEKYTFQDLWDEAGGIAYYLRVGENLLKGDRVLLCYSFGLQFFAAFLGCLRAGIVAVLNYPPTSNNLTTSLPKLNKIAENCDAKLILVDSLVNKLKTFDQKNPISKSRHL